MENALRVFAVYRACDIGLLVGVFAMHHWAGTASFAGGLPLLTGSAGDGGLPASAARGGGKGRAGSVLRMAAARHGRSHAVERHLLRRDLDSRRRLPAAPSAALLAQSRLASALVIAIGVATAVHGTIVGRASADAKTSLAYASLTQVGVVFVEIGFGWTSIAVAHILGHAIGPHAAVPARAIDASRLSPDALRHRRRAVTDRQAPGGSVSGARPVVALSLGARPRPSRHDSRSLRDSIR